MTATCWGWLRHLLQMPCWVRSSHTGQCKVVKYCEIVPFRPSGSLREELVAFWIYSINSEKSLSLLQNRAAILRIITGLLRHYSFNKYWVVKMCQALENGAIEMNSPSFHRAYILISSDILVFWKNHFLPLSILVEIHRCMTSYRARNGRNPGREWILFMAA